MAASLAMEWNTKDGKNDSQVLFPIRGSFFNQTWGQLSPSQASTYYVHYDQTYIYCWVVEILWMAVQMSTWLKISILRRRWILPRRKWLGTRPRRTNADEGLIVCMWLAFMDVNIYFLEYGSLIHRGYQPPHLPQGLPSITFGNCIGLDSYK